MSQNSTLHIKSKIVNKTGAIVIIEDDADDQEILSEIFKELQCPNEIIFFSDGLKALDYLKLPLVTPFLVISDINMPKLNGFDLRKSIFENKELSSKCIPYLFFTTAADKQSVIDAYSLSVQGFFVKPTSVVDLRRIIRRIIDYWSDCYSPNQV